MASACLAFEFAADIRVKNVLGVRMVPALAIEFAT